MKLQDLFESPDDWRKSAKKMGYASKLEVRKLSGKSRDVIVLSKVKEVFETQITFEYIVNPETSAWSFIVKNDKNEMEISSGEDSTSLSKHLEKKSKLSKHNFEKYFK